MDVVLLSSRFFTRPFVVPEPACVKFFVPSQASLSFFYGVFLARQARSYSAAHVFVFVQLAPLQCLPLTCEVLESFSELFRYL